MGVSAKEYLNNVRLRNFESILRKDGQVDVTGAIFEAGFGSLSRLYEKAGAQLGMAPILSHDRQGVVFRHSA